MFPCLKDAEDTGWKADDQTEVAQDEMAAGVGTEPPKGLVDAGSTGAVARIVMGASTARCVRGAVERLLQLGTLRQLGVQAIRGNCNVCLHK
jgi:hypothetical protein